MVATTASFFTEHAETVSLIHHDGAVILMLQLYDLGKISEVALHREHAVHNDELHSLVWQTLEDVLQVLHVVVLIVELTSKRESASVYDAGMVAVVTDNIVTTSHYNGKHA